MDYEELQVRLEEADAKIVKLAEIMTNHSSANTAHTAVVLGLLSSVGHLPGVQEAVHEQLEQSLAIGLGMNTNEPGLQKLAQYAELFTAALNESPGK